MSIGSFFQSAIFKDGGTRTGSSFSDGDFDVASVIL